MRLPEDQDWEDIDKELLVDCAQLTKANSIEGISFAREFLHVKLFQMAKIDGS